MHATAGERLLEADEAIILLYYLMLENVSELIPNNLLYGLQNGQSELEELGLQKSYLPLLFATLPELTRKA